MSAVRARCAASASAYLPWLCHTFTSPRRRANSSGPCARPVPANTIPHTSPAVTIAARPRAILPAIMAHPFAIASPNGGDCALRNVTAVSCESCLLFIGLGERPKLAQGPTKDRGCNRVSFLDVNRRRSAPGVGEGSVLAAVSELDPHPSDRLSGLRLGSSGAAMNSLKPRKAAP